MKHFELLLGKEPQKKKKWLYYFSLDGVMYMTDYFNDITK